MRCFYAPLQGTNMQEEEHPMEQEPLMSIQHIIITSTSTSVVEVIERIILPDLIQPTTTMGIQVI
jgi:hypothetical protein